MPCDSVRWIEVEIKPTKIVNEYAVGERDRALLALALDALGVTKYTYNGDTLKIVTWDQKSDLTLDQIKEAYSVEIVKATAKRFGWLTKNQETTAAQEQRFVFAKR